MSTYRDFLDRLATERGCFISGAWVLDEIAAYGATDDLVTKYLERTASLALPGDHRERDVPLAARLRASTPADLAEWARTLRSAAAVNDAYLRGAAQGGKP